MDHLFRSEIVLAVTGKTYVLLAQQVFEPAGVRVMALDTETVGNGIVQGLTLDELFVFVTAEAELIFISGQAEPLPGLRLVRILGCIKADMANPASHVDGGMNAFALVLIGVTISTLSVGSKPR